MCVVGLAGACSGDDREEGDVGTGGGAGVETTVASGSECLALQVLLKLDLSDDERAEVQAKVAEVDGVTGTELRAAEAEGEPPVLLVTTESAEASTAVSEELSGDPSVVSVVHPEQVC